jgi:FkbM family methyltransferase
MKKKILKLLNRLLKPIHTRIIRIDPLQDLGMDAMLGRLCERDLGISTVIDIGASNAKWSLSCMKYFPSSNYLAIEPLDERRAELQCTAEKYRNFDYALCVAGAHDHKKVSLHVTSDLDGSTVCDGNSETSRICNTRTIDSLVSEKQLSGPFLLKFDTHGYELPILGGCSKTLQQTTAIIMESYNFRLTPSALRFHEMCTYLEELGFRTVDIAEPLLRQYDKSFWQCDFLFLRSDSEIFNYPDYR